MFYHTFSQGLILIVTAIFIQAKDEKPCPEYIFTNAFGRITNVQIFFPGVLTQRTRLLILILTRCSFYLA